MLHSLIHSGYFYSASSSPLLLRDAPDCSIDTVSELTRRSATGNCERRTCPRSLPDYWSGIRTCDLPDAIALIVDCLKHAKSNFILTILYNLLHRCKIHFLRFLFFERFSFIVTQNV